jgi:hypothetical protein
MHLLPFNRKKIQRSVPAPRSVTYTAVTAVFLREVERPIEVTFVLGPMSARLSVPSTPLQLTLRSVSAH